MEHGLVHDYLQYEEHSVVQSAVPRTATQEDFDFLFGSIIYLLCFPEAVCVLGEVTGRFTAGIVLFAMPKTPFLEFTRNGFRSFWQGNEILEV